MTLTQLHVEIGFNRPNPVSRRLLVDFDTLAREVEWVPRSTWRVWRHRKRIQPVACDVQSHAELYDVGEANQLEAATRDERIERMCLFYRR